MHRHRGSATAQPPPARTPRPPTSFATDVPMEANAIDTDSLDDDAFFASLREAVRDDAPLGPRDDEQAQFFDDRLRAGPPALPPSSLTLRR